MGERITRGCWELLAIRNKAGNYTCVMTDSNGTVRIEPVHAVALAIDSRAWSNPADEIARVKQLSEFLLGANGLSCSDVHVEAHGG